jgi:hypothetical protein
LEKFKAGPIAETEEGPMSVWEAIQKLRLDAKLVGGLANGHHLYLDKLRLKLPKIGELLWKIWQRAVTRIFQQLASISMC